MDKTILAQYTDMKAEQRDLLRRIQSLDARILNMETNMIVADTVTCGKKGKKPLGTVKIEGFPSRDYQKRKKLLRKYKQMLSDKSDDLLEVQIQVEDYISDIQDAQTRLIMRCRFIDDMTWKQVAKTAHISEDAARMMVNRYLEK